MNPFVWNLTLFGKPMTNLDGGIWNISLGIPPNFPDVQPRVRFESKIFHHRVSKDGVLCYFPKKEDEIATQEDLEHERSLARKVLKRMVKVCSHFSLDYGFC